MENVCIIQARMGSSRLPNKVMKKLDKKNTVLDYVINQIQDSKLIQKIVIATTTEKEDDEIVTFANNANIEFFRGSIHDVLDRYYQCARTFSASTIIRITSDDPLIDPTIIDDAILKFHSNSYDFVATQPPRSFPQGTEVEIFSFDALENAWYNTIKPSEREHVTPFFYNTSNKFKIFILKHKPDLSHLRWTIDRQNDLELIRLLVSKIQKRPILTKDILDLLDIEPQLIEINKNNLKDEGYLKSLQEDREFLNKNN